METDTKNKKDYLKDEIKDMLDQNIKDYQKIMKGGYLAQLPKYNTLKFIIHRNWRLADKGIEPSLLEKGIVRCSNKEANDMFSSVKPEYTLGRDMIYGDIIIVNNKTNKVISLA